jgi:hypothetical protein
MWRLVYAVLFAAALCAAAWGVSDRLEQQNDFCNACHLPDGTTLHLETREDFERVIPVDLAGVHGRGWVEEREDPAFRCIDCHAGSGPWERTRVKLLAARDAVRYAVGSFEEPKGMPFQLSPATCQRCHPGFRHSAAPGWTLEAYHGHPDHDGPEAPRCVACHAVHEKDGDAFAYFMARERIDARCRHCHAVGSEREIESLVVPGAAGGPSAGPGHPRPGGGGRGDANAATRAGAHAPRRGWRPRPPARPGSASPAAWGRCPSPPARRGGRWRLRAPGA